MKNKSKITGLAILVVGAVAMGAVSLAGRTGEAASIAIIGGADGPTAIFVASEFPTMTTMVALAVIGIGAIAIWLFAKNKRKDI